MPALVDIFNLIFNSTRNTIAVEGNASGTPVPVSGTVTATASGTQATSVADGSDVTEGVTTGAAVSTDANGTLQQYLRGLVKLWVAGLAAGSQVIGKVGIDQTTPGTTNVVELKYSYGRVTADGQIKGSAGFIHTVSVAALTATPTAGLFTVYDSTAESGTVIYSEWFFATDPGHTIILDVAAATGIYVGFDAALANVQVTVAYR